MYFFQILLVLISLLTRIVNVSIQINGFNYCNPSLIFLFDINHLFALIAQSAGAVEYTDCTSAEA